MTVFYMITGPVYTRMVLLKGGKRELITTVENQYAGEAHKTRLRYLEVLTRERSVLQDKNVYAPHPV